MGLREESDDLNQVNGIPKQVGPVTISVFRHDDSFVHAASQPQSAAPDRSMDHRQRTAAELYHWLNANAGRLHLVYDQRRPGPFRRRPIQSL